MKSRKLKILQVGWGWPPHQKGGAIFYTKSLCTELSNKGHEVHYFFTGDQNLAFLPYLKRRQENGIDLIQLVNSPNLYNTRFNSPKSELSNKTIEIKFRKVLSIVQPDVVHFQNFAGICASLPNIAKGSGYVVIYSMHNYMPICPLGELFDYSTFKICDLKHCANCYARGGFLSRIKTRIMIAILYSLPDSLRKKVVSLITSDNIKPNIATPDIKTTKILEKLITKRLQYFSHTLSEIDLNLAVSGKVQELYLEHLHLPQNKILVDHVGTEESQHISYHPKESKNEKITFIFLGSLDPHKGFQNLLEAFKEVNQTKAQLVVYGPLDKKYSTLKDELEHHYSIVFKGSYSLDQLNDILSSADVGVVPPIWHDNAPRVVFEMLSAKLPLIVSSAGGMSDFVKDGINGFVFQYDNPKALKDKLETFIANPRLINKFRDNIIPMKSISTHIKEIESIYRQLVDQEKIKEGDKKQT